MLTKLLQRFVGELICSSRDGSVSLSRLAATTAHLLSAVFFVYHNLTAPFSELLWLTYLGFATGHAVYDKTLMVKKASQPAATETT